MFYDGLVLPIDLIVSRNKIEAYYSQAVKVLHLCAVRLFLFAALVLSLAAADALAAQQEHDVRVLVDVSGSMKKSDPQNLRQPALKLLVELFPEGIQAGIWTFGEVLQPLVPLSEVDQNWKIKAKPSIEKMHSDALWTHMGLALEQASVGWEQPDLTQSRSLILLTDGKVDISKEKHLNKMARNDIIEKILPRLKDSNVKIHTIALSQYADSALLKALAISTDGRFERVENATDLVSAFVGTFDKTIEQDQLPIKDNQFEVDNSVDEFTLLVHRIANSPPTKLMSPSQRVYSDANVLHSISWFTTPTFDLVTVRKPESGVWEINAVLESGGRVTIVSDLALQLDGLPNNILQAEKIDVNVALTEEGVPIQSTEFLSLLDIEFKQTYLDQKQVWRGMLTSFNANKVLTPINGIYQAKLGKTLLPGEHEFQITVDGKTFKRQKKHRLTVLKSAVDVRVEEELSSVEAVGSQYFLNVSPAKGILDFDESYIHVSIIDPAGGMENVVGERTPFGTWRADILPTQGNGRYVATVHVKGKTPLGRSVEVAEEAIEVIYSNIPLKDDPVSEVHSAAESSGQTKIISQLSTTEADTALDAEEDLSVTTPESEASLEADNGGISKLMIAVLIIGNVVLFIGIFCLYRYFVKRENQESIAAEKQLKAVIEQYRLENEPVAEAPDTIAEVSNEDLQAQKNSVASEVDVAKDSGLQEALTSALDIDISIKDDS